MARRYCRGNCGFNSPHKTKMWVTESLSDVEMRIRGSVDRTTMTHDESTREVEESSMFHGRWNCRPARYLVPPLGRSAGSNANRMECEVSRNASEIKFVREIDLMEGKSVMPPGKPTLCSLVSKNACLNPVWMARLTPCL